MGKELKKCDHKDCDLACKHKVDKGSLEKSISNKKKIVEGKKIVNKK